MTVQKKIDVMRSRVIAWLETMSLKDHGFGVFTNSGYNKKLKLEDMYFPASYNAGHCLKLLGAYENISSDDKSELASFLNGFQRKDGLFRMGGMKKEDLNYPDFEYVDFHQTNYAMGLFDSLEIDTSRFFSFLRNYNSEKKLDRWLSRRDMSNPWTEGNYVVNLASFYIRMMEKGSKRDSRKYHEHLNRLILWHESMQDPSTGYWCEKGYEDLVGAMAGASHNFHIYYYLNKPVPYYEKIIDHCLGILDNGVSSACLDIDVVDVLCNFIKYNYRTKDIRTFLENKLSALLAYQNKDGGFSDVETGTRYFDGWSVYREPQGISNCFATWFRCVAIGMIDCTLYPENSGNWHFRRSIGMGYFNKNYLIDGFDKDFLTDYKAPSPEKSWIPKGRGKNHGPRLNDNCSVSVENLSQMVLDKLNAADLSAFSETKIFAFKVREDNGHFAVAISADGAELIPFKEGNYDILLIIAAGNLIKLLRGKMLAVYAYGTKKLKIRGEITLALKLQDLIF